MKVLKGTYGYIKAGRKREWIRTLLLFCISLSLLLIGMLVAKHRNPDISWGQSKNNLLTVAAVLGVLPAARFLISAIMFTRASKYSCPASLHEALLPLAEGHCIAYELYLTGYQENFPLYAVCCTDNEILALLAEGKAEAGEEHIREALKREGLKNVTVKLFTEEGAFLRRLQTASAGGESAEKLLTLLYQISL
ncbi:MAG: hypothetical protein IK115_10920 [Lachnospiraceae bacterium]|nr:hypothetical protein [Lachnospiraceae bacterium]